MIKKFLLRRRIVLVVAVVVFIYSQTLYFYPVRDFSRNLLAVPAHWLSRNVGQVGNVVRLIRSINSLESENTSLKNDNLALQSQLAELEAVRGENTKLKTDLNFQQARPDLTLIPAEILLLSADNGYQSFTINKGEIDGLKLEQAVVTNGFVIGKVKRLSEHTAEVWQLSNRNLLTPVTLAKSQTTGILRGGLRGLVIENIPSDTGVEKGEAVVTSSLEGLYPGGLAVGKIEEILSKKEEIFITVRVSSPVNIKNLGTVFVIHTKE